jgi:hypothetical protein
VQAGGNVIDQGLSKPISVGLLQQTRETIEEMAEGERTTLAGFIRNVLEEITQTGKHDPNAPTPEQEMEARIAAFQLKLTAMAQHKKGAYNGKDNSDETQKENIKTHVAAAGK